jgi:hypothetical protein
VHVASCPLTHDVCPALQLLVQVSAHVELGEVPEHDIGEVHVVVPDW